MVKKELWLSIAKMCMQVGMAEWSLCPHSDQRVAGSILGHDSLWKAIGGNSGPCNITFDWLYQTGIFLWMRISFPLLHWRVYKPISVGDRWSWPPGDSCSCAGNVVLGIANAGGPPLIAPHSLVDGEAPEEKKAINIINELGLTGHGFADDCRTIW